MIPFGVVPDGVALVTVPATATMPPERKHLRTEASRARARPSRIPNGPDATSARSPPSCRWYPSPVVARFRRPPRPLPSSSTTPPSGIRRPPWKAPGSPALAAPRPPRGLRAERPGSRRTPRTAGSCAAAATPATGSSSSTARTAPRPSTRSTPAPSDAPRATSSAAAGARSSTSGTARTRPTSTPARATGRGPTPTTRPTVAEWCCGPAWCAWGRSRLRGCEPQALGRSPGRLVPARAGLTAGAGLPGPPPGRPPAFARSARACTARRCVAAGACEGAGTALAGGRDRPDPLERWNLQPEPEDSTARGKPGRPGRPSPSLPGRR
jgi:hypothetical protein